MTASASVSGVTAGRSRDDSTALKRSQAAMKPLYSAQLTSWAPIQNGSIVTSNCGPSSSLRPSSSAGLPMRNVPPGTGTIRKVTSLPGIVSS